MLPFASSAIATAWSRQICPAAASQQRLRATSSRAVSTDRGASVPSANDLDSLISPRAEADDREVLVVGPGAKLTSAFNCRESLPVGQREVLVGPLMSDLPGSEVILVVELLAGTGRVLCAALIAASPVSGLVAPVVTSSALCSEPILFSSQVNPLQN
jgi:hypothetical protein